MKKSQKPKTNSPDLIPVYFKSLGEIEYNIQLLERQMTELRKNKDEIVQSINLINEIQHIYNQQE